MIRSVHLHPYKLHADLSIGNIPLVSLVVGRNNSGKSAVLQAMALPKYGLRWDTALPTAPTDEPTRSGQLALVDISFDSAGDSVTIRVEAQGNGVLQWNVSRPSGSTGGGGRIPAPGQYGAIEFQNVPSYATKVFFLGPHRSVPDRSFNYQAFARDIGPSGEGCWNTIHQLKADDNPAFQSIREVTVGMGFGVSGVQTPTVSVGSGAIRMNNHGRADVLPFMGSGIGSILPVITQGMLCEPGETLLVEEPELHMHQGSLEALAKFFGQLARRRVQVILTSHSTALFSAFKVQIDNHEVPDDTAVFLVDRDAGGMSSVQRFTVDDYHRAMNAASRVLGRS